VLCLWFLRYSEENKNWLDSKFNEHKDIMREFDNVIYKNNELVEVIKIKLTIPCGILDDFEVVTSNRELIHIYINTSSLFKATHRNEIMRDRVLNILLCLDVVSIEAKCFFEDWNMSQFYFELHASRKLTNKESKRFLAFKSDLIADRIQSQENSAWQEYLDIGHGRYTRPLCFKK
jgi:hypothetical protein